MVTETPPFRVGPVAPDARLLSHMVCAHRPSSPTHPKPTPGVSCLPFVACQENRANKPVRHVAPRVQRADEGPYLVPAARPLSPRYAPPPSLSSHRTPRASPLSPSSLRGVCAREFGANSFSGTLPHEYSALTNLAIWCPPRGASPIYYDTTFVSEPSLSSHPFPRLASHLTSPLPYVACQASRPKPNLRLAAPAVQGADEARSLVPAVAHIHTMYMCPGLVLPPTPRASRLSHLSHTYPH